MDEQMIERLSREAVALTQPGVVTVTLSWEEVSRLSGIDWNPSNVSDDNPVYWHGLTAWKKMQYALHLLQKEQAREELAGKLADRLLRPDMTRPKGEHLTVSG